jgi:hypothetical protein
MRISTPLRGARACRCVLQRAQLHHFSRSPSLSVDAAAEGSVRNGRLLLDEPTDLPDGNIVELVELDDVLTNGGDDLDDEERVALHRELEASFAEEASGQLIDLADAMTDLRTRA